MSRGSAGTEHVPVNADMEAADLLRWIAFCDPWTPLLVNSAKWPWPGPASGHHPPRGHPLAYDMRWLLARLRWRRLELKRRKKRRLCPLPPPRPCPLPPLSQSRRAQLRAAAHRSGGTLDRYDLEDLLSD